MKRILYIVGAAMLLSFAAGNLKADVSTNTTAFGVGTDSTNLTQLNFFQNLASWGTTRFASGLTWPANDLDIDVGSDYASQSQWDNYVAITKNLGSFYGGAQINNAGIAGTVKQLGGRAGYTLSNGGDLRIKAGIYGGYQLHDDGLSRKGMVVQPELGGEKLITGPTADHPTTSTTYIAAWLYYPFQFHGAPPSTPGFKLGAGATF